uniref:Replication protein A 32 kDa subunit n=1 Tax=Lingulaulax polyedra TaxID=160621 RepID=A0A516AG37_LINPO|nr:replication protein A 32 kDa subunit [Lingulodinium polyedra]
MLGAPPSLLASQGPGLATGLAAQEGAAKKARHEDKQTCLPVTVRAVEEALGLRGDEAGEGLRFHGTDQGMLILVGVVEGLVRQPASVEFTLNDTTGRIKARHYLVSQEAKALQDLAEGQYVCVFGSVRAAPTLHVAVAGLRPLESPDEVSYHMVEAAHAALKLQKAGELPTTPSPRRPAAAAAQAPGEPGAAPMELSAPKRARLEGAALRGAVLAFLRGAAAGRPEGASLAALCGHLQPAPEEEVRAALQALVGDGDVYNTLDENHFQCV